jgi:hypothetical protein
MTYSELYRIESKLLHDIEAEKKFTWRKLFKIMELDVVAKQLNNF